MLQMGRYSKHILIIFLIISAVLSFMRFNSLQVGASYDDAHYIILAESLSSGQGYQLINFPRPQNERAFPPGWPILLIPFTFLLPGNYTILKLFSVLLWLASIVLIYKFFSRRMESPYLEIITGLTALNPLLVGSSVTVMSESAYLFFSLLTLNLVGSWKNESEVKKYWLILLIAGITFYAQLIRTIGISLCIALFLYFLLTRRWREAGLTIFIFISGILLQTWMTVNNGGGLVATGYQSQVLNGSVVAKMGQMASNALGYFREVLAGTLIPIFGTKLSSLLSNYGLEILPTLANIIILLFIVFGIVVSRKKIDLLDLYSIIYILGILAFWNPKVGSVKARFLIPIIPFLYFYLISGINWAIAKITGNNHERRINLGTGIMAGVAVFIGLTLLVSNVQDWRNPVMDQMTDLSIGTSWVAVNAAPDAIVMVNEPVPAYVHARRKTIAYPNAEQDLLKYLENQAVDYIVIAPKLQSPRTTGLDQSIEQRVLPILNSAPDQFVVVYINSEYNVRVYKVEGDVTQ